VFFSERHCEPFFGEAIRIIHDEIGIFEIASAKLPRLAMTEESDFFPYEISFRRIIGYLF
jgi:hypothetical protein